MTGWIDLSARGRLRLTGADRIRFLQGMVTNDIDQLPVGQSLRAAMLTPKGRVIADMLVRKDEDALWVSTEPELRQKLREALERFIVMDDVTVEDVTEKTVEIGVYGPHPPKLDVPVLVAPLGIHLLQKVDLALPELSPEEVEVMRVERGVTRYGADISEQVLPLEAGLDDAISHTKGCYIGQEPVARVTARGHVNKKIVGLRCQALPRPGDVVSAADRPEAGAVTSVAQSKTLGPIALAFLHRSLWAPGTKVTAGGIEAEVAELPMVRW